MLLLTTNGNRLRYNHHNKGKSREGAHGLLGVLLCIFAYLAGLGIVPDAAWAAPLDMQKIKEIPQYGEEYSAEEFFNKSRLYRVKTQGAPHLEFSIRIPEDWSRSHSDLTDSSENMTVQEDSRSTNIVNQRLLGKIARFLGPPRMDNISYLEVEMLELQYSVSLKNWLLNHIIGRGVTLQGMREVNENRYEVLFNQISDDAAYAVRMLVNVSGSTVVLASYYMPEKYWQEERAQQERVVNSFEFMDPKERKVEDIATYQFLDLLRFDYPVSWKLLAPNIYSTDGMEARIVNTRDGKVLDGEIRLTILSTDLEVDFVEEVGFIREDLDKMGLKIGNLKDLEDVSLDLLHYDHIIWNKIEVYEVKREGGKASRQDYEFWLGIFIEDRYYYMITMLTPTRDRDFLTWARNFEAYQKVVGSIRP